MKNPRNWLILLAAMAAAGTFAIQSAMHKQQPPPADPALTFTAVNEPWTDTPSSADSGPCGYTWAYYNNLPLSEELDAAVRKLDSSASAYAQAFGEDCIYSDEHKEFSAMETDFYISSPALDLTDQAALGNWIMQVMPLVLQLPAEELQGPRPGFVEFTFVKNDRERLILRVPIDQYKAVSTDKSAIDIFRYFYIPPTSPT